MIHILDFIAYYYHHRIKFQINILVWRKALLVSRNAWCCSCHFLLVTIVNFFLLLLERQNYSKYLTLVLKSGRQGWNSFPQSLAMKIFCGKESKSISKIHLHKARIFTTVGTIFQMLLIAGWFGRMKSQMKSPKCVTLLSHFYLELLFLWDRSQHINWFCMCCSYEAHDKVNWIAVSWGQFANRSLKLVIHWRQMGIGFLLTPKEDFP